MRLTQEQKKYVRLNHSNMSIKEMAGHLGVEPKDVRWAMAELGLVPTDVVKRERAEKRRSARRGSWKGFLNWVDALKRPRVAFWLVVGLALAVRLAHLLVVHEQALFVHLAEVEGQAGLLHALAMDISAGDWLARGQAIFQQDALYPYLLALVYLLSGPSALAVGLLQILLSAFTAGMICRLGGRLFGPLTGLLAGLMAAFYGLFVMYSVLPVPTTLVLLLSVAVLEQLASSLSSPRWWRWIFVGLLLGMALVARAQLVLFVPFAGLSILLWFGPKNVRRWLPATALMGLGSLVFLAPCLLHNRLIGQELVFFNTSLGQALYAANGPDADGLSPRGTSFEGHHLGWTAQSRQANHLSIARAQLRKPKASAAASSDFWRAQALERMWSDSGAWLSLVGRKVGYFSNAYEIPGERSLAFWQDRSVVLGGPLLTYGIVFPLGLLGLLLSLRGFRKRSSLVFFFLVALVNSAVFYPGAEQRLVAVPVILIYSAAVLRWLWLKMRKRQWIHLGLSLICLVAGFWATYRAMPALDVRYDELASAQALALAGEREQALVMFDRARAAGADFLPAHLAQGSYLIRLGRKKQGRALLQDTLQRARAAGDGYTITRIEKVLGVRGHPAAREEEKGKSKTSRGLPPPEDEAASKRAKPGPGPEKAPPGPGPAPATVRFSSPGRDSGK